MAPSNDPFEWVEKAEGDAEAAPILMQRFLSSIAHTIAFHAPQSAEKYLKAVLIQELVAFPRTHDLAQLIALVVSKQPSLAALRAAASALQPYAIEIRYPGNDPTQSECVDALMHMEDVRGVCRAALGLPP